MHVTHGVNPTGHEHAVHVRARGDVSRPVQGVEMYSIGEDLLYSLKIQNVKNKIKGSEIIISPDIRPEFIM